MPSNIVRKVERLSKELETVKREIKRAVKVQKSQFWFWSKAWQKKEKTADKDIKADRVHTFSSAKDLIEDLHK